MIETGLHVIYNTGSRLHYAVDVQESYAGIAVFAPCDAGEGVRDGVGVMTWANLAAELATPYDYADGAGFVDLRGNGIFVPDLPGCLHGGIYKGRSYVFPDGMRGHDEITDHALIDIMTDNAGFPQPWRNRFAQSAREKVDLSFRHRARTGLECAGDFHADQGAAIHGPDRDPLRSGPDPAERHHVSLAGSMTRDPE